MPRRIKQGGTKMPLKDKEKQSMTSDEAYKMKAGGLSAGQKKIAAKAPPPNKIDAKDFAVLRAEKAKGRGMGLQDEKLKPGKVMKAKTGKQIAKEFSASLKGIDESFKSKVHPMKKQRLLDRSTVMKARVGKSIDKKAYMKTIGVFPTIDKVTPTVKGKQLPVAKNILNAAKATRYGKIALGIAGVALGAKELLKSKMKKEDKKMVGGMAKKYSVGGGADAGRAGIIKGINANLQDKAERRLNVPDRTDIKKQKASVTKLKQQAKRSRLETMKERQTGRPVYERMVGGMAKKYNKGGGADTGKMGEIKSQFAVASDRVRRTKRDGDRLTQRDLDFIKKATQKRMGGGMMQKPMGGPMGGMMQRPMGYKKGTMVKARGCKLGRTRPTKMY